jgi:hypothetical protein
LVLVFLLTPCVAVPAAESDAPVSVALVAESPGASQALDLLTAELSTNSALRLLERSELDKVYREQNLATANLDTLKLGKLLGADGLLLISQRTDTSGGGMRFTAPAGSFAQPKATLSFQVRLVSVRAGAILDAMRSTCREDELPAWAELIVAHFAPDWRKVAIPPKQAIPISVLNFRSSVNSADARETELQLKLLTIDRLSHERTLFILERRRMAALSAEKELSLDDSTFWKGSYLLDAVVDPGGYSPETVEVNARLTPPRGGTPVTCSAKGSRTNLSEVVDQLARKITLFLKSGPPAEDWKPDDEAAQYSAEARWMLKWGLFQEAQSAAESAWALGRKDMDSAILRIKSYLVPTTYDRQQRGSLTVIEVGPSRETAARTPPTSADAERAERALVLYLDFSQTLDPKLLKPDSLWCSLGVQDLVAASRVLQHFYLVPPAPAPVPERLQELRSAARAVSDWMKRLPAMRNTYFIDDRIASSDEVYQNFVVHSNAFRCALEWGAFWQERPEDTLALYRELMSGTLFPCIREGLWFRAPNSPRLVDWASEDEKNLSALWDGLVNELSASTNNVPRLEAKALRLSDICFQYSRPDQPPNLRDYDPLLQNGAEELFDFIFTNFDSIVAENENLAQLDWGLRAFFIGSGAVTPAREEVARRYRAEWEPRLEALQANYSTSNERFKEQKNRLTFERQRRFLQAMAPYDIRAFTDAFSVRNYSKAQAEELRPLLDAYTSNILARASASSRQETFQAKANTNWVELVAGHAIDSAIKGAAPFPMPGNAKSTTENSMTTPAVSPSRGPEPGTLAPTASSDKELLLKDLVRLPRERLGGTNILGLSVGALRWSQARLLLTLHYQGPFQNYQLVSQAATAVFDPDTSNWEVIRHPKEDTRPTVGSLPTQILFGTLADHGSAFSEIFNGQFYLSDAGQIQRWDPKIRKWEVLAIPESKDSQLFALDGHLYGANEESIFEILENGRTTRVLASTRRRPALSSLDSFDALGSPMRSPVLFSGPNRILCAALNGQVFAWNGRDWTNCLAIPFVHTPGVLSDAVIFRSLSATGPSRLWMWRNGEAAPELCLVEAATPRPGFRPQNVPPAQNDSQPPLWKSVKGSHLVASPVAVRGGDLVFLPFEYSSDLSRAEMGLRFPTEPRPRLICLRRGHSDPLIVQLKFADEAENVPGAIPKSQPTRRSSSGWLAFCGDFLLLGMPGHAGFWKVPVKDLEAAMSASP